jgi:drug/metabolite transporter (DMT)-like permease
MTDTVVGLVAAVVAAALFGVGAVLQAHGVRQESEPMDTLREFVAAALRNPFILGVVAAYLAGFVLHAVSIWYLPLYLAQSAVALSLPVTALSAAKLRERLGLREWSAVLGIVLGLVLVSLGSADPGEGRSSPLFALLLWVGVVLLLGFGFRGRSLGAGTLGAVAGLGYAGSAIAVRGVALPLDAWVVAAAAAVPVFGLLAFWLYSLALARSAVAASSAPLVVCQTLVPAAVGIWFLGDSVRDGWTGVVAVSVGMLAAIVGAILLSRTTAGQDLVEDEDEAAPAQGASPPSASESPGIGTP